MADKPAKKRLVKNPETFRERALKSSLEDDKPKRSHKIRQASSKAAAPIARTSSQLSNVPIFKPIRWLFKLIGKIFLPKYIRNSWKELKQVTWLSWRQSIRLTYAVIVFSIIFGIVVAGVDYVLDKFFREFLLR